MGQGGASQMPVARGQVPPINVRSLTLFLETVALITSGMEPRNDNCFVVGQRQTGQRLHTGICNQYFSAFREFRQGLFNFYRLLELHYR